MQTKVHPAEQKSASLKIRLGLALLLLALACLWCLPALLSTATPSAFQHDTLISNFWQPFSPSTEEAEKAEANFIGNWQAAGDQLLDFQLPLWQNSGAPGGQPFLATSEAPLLYPPSFSYYLIRNYGLYLVFHLWVALGGIVLLARRLPRRVQLPFGLMLGLLALLFLPPLRPDHLAALSWLPLAFWLPLLPRYYIRLIALTLVLGLIGLAIALPAALLLAGLCLLWLVGVDVYRAKNRTTGLIKALFAAFIVLALAAGVAGPQLFPRLAYQPVSYVELSGPIKITNLSPADLKLTEIIPVSYSETQYRISLPPQYRGKIEFTVPERFDNGWQAHYTLPADAKKFSNEAQLESTPAGWRKVTLGPVESSSEITVRLRYNPLSILLGLYASFLSVSTLALGLLVLGWIRFYREDEQDHPLRRITKNSVTPLFAQLVGRALDFGFAFISLRLLGPEGNGRYTVAITIWLFFSTLSDFGLETLVTREVARERTAANANRYFSTMLATRTAFSTLSLPLALLWAGGLNLSGSLSSDAIWATALLMIGMIPNSLSGTMSAVFRGYEKFEFLAAIQILGSIIRVPLGLAALLIGWGVIGLAATAIAVNMVTAASLWAIFRREVIRPDLRTGFDRALVKPMLVAAFPLMLNGFLINLMFKSDVFLLLPFKGETEVGLYNSAYKFIDALLIIPSTITMALFPLFSSYSRNDKEEMLRTYREGLRLLAIISLPISAGMLFVANDLIGLAFGDNFLPGGAIALQILIWFLPFSYINGITQYVLIALDHQRSITWAVLITAACNIILNLIFIPFFGYIAASAMTISTEVILLGIYWIIMRRIIAPIPLWETLSRSGAAALVMLVVLAGLTIGLDFRNFFVTVALGAVVYIGCLVIFRAVTDQDMRYLRKILHK